MFSVSTIVDKIIIIIIIIHSFRFRTHCIYIVEKNIFQRRQRRRLVQQPTQNRKESSESERENSIVTNREKERN